MARGWESKSVEHQQAEAEQRRQPAGNRPLTEAERIRQTRRDVLLLSRTRVLQELQTACHPNHRATLEASLGFIDRELEALDRTP